MIRQKFNDAVMLAIIVRFDDSAFAVVAEPKHSGLLDRRSQQLVELRIGCLQSGASRYASHYEWEFMTTKKTAKESADSPVDPRFALVADAFAGDKNVTFGKLMASYGLKVNGKIFAMFARGRFVAKLPKIRVDELVAGGEGDRFDPGHGRLMKEWVSLVSGKQNWVELAREAYEFVKRRDLAERPKSR